MLWRVKIAEPLLHCPEQLSVSHTIVDGMGKTMVLCRFRMVVIMKLVTAGRLWSVVVEMNVWISRVLMRCPGCTLCFLTSSAVWGMWLMKGSVHGSALL